MFKRICFVLLTISTVVMYSITPTIASAAAPVISGIQALGITETEAWIYWSTDISATSEIVYSNTSHSGSTYTSEATAETAYGSYTAKISQATLHYQKLSSLTNGSTYYYRVISTSGSDIAISAESSFTTHYFTISGVGAGNITFGTATIAWNTSVNATSNVEYGTSTSYGSTAPLPADTSADKTGHSVALSGLSPATTYHYRVVSKDGSANQEVAGDFTFTTSADTTAPAVSSVATSGIDATTAIITWVSNEPATSQVAYSTTSHSGSTYTTSAAAVTAYGSSSPEDATKITSHSVALSGLILGTTYYYRVMSKDASGNGVVSSEYSFATASDIIPPVISSVGSSGLGNTVAAIVWSTNEPATSQVTYGITSHSGSTYTTATAAIAAYGSSNSKDASFLISHSQLLDSLSSGTTYYYRVISIDPSGNEAVSAESSFSTTADTIAPVISSVNVSKTDTTITITWTTNEASTSQVEYGTTGTYGSATSIDNNKSISHTVVISGLTAGTLYHYRVKSRDVSNNEGMTGDTTFTTLADTTAPTISLIIAGSITTTSTTITWNTNEASTSQVEYGTNTSYGSATPLDYSKVTSHVVVLTGLTSGAAYYYRVKSKDSSDNEATSSQYTFSTTADTTAPVISSVAASLPGSYTVNLTWSTDEPSTSQVIYSTDLTYSLTTTLDATLVTSHSVALSGLTPGTTYHYKVKSKDAYNNLQTSGDNTFATAVDTTPPVLLSMQVTSITAATAMITWTTDEAANSVVESGISTSYGSTASNALLVINHSMVLSGLVPLTTYHYRVKSTDAYTNTATSVDQTFTTIADTTPPVISAVTTGSITATGAVITWTTNKGSSSQITYGTTSHSGSTYTTVATAITAYGLSSTKDATALTSHSLGLSSLTSAVKYYYRVISIDSSNNESISAESSFTTLDNIPPVISSVNSGNLTATSVTVTWTTNEGSTSQITYSTTSHSGSIYATASAAIAAYGLSNTKDAAVVTSHSQGLSGLTSIVKYYYRVISADASGNESVSLEYSFTTLDNIPPVITVGATSGLTITSVTITWTTGEASTSQIEYGTSTSYGSSTTLDSTMTTTHSVNISGLTAGTLYHYRVKSKDVSNNEAASSDSTFTTAKSGCGSTRTGDLALLAGVVGIVVVVRKLRLRIK